MLNESEATQPTIKETAQPASTTKPDSLDFVSPTYLSEGRIVNVESRTWPGINKPGGIGRISKIYTQLVSFGGSRALKVTHVDVKFLVNGGRENKVDVNYVKHAPEYEDELQERSLRDRSALLGRCTLCKSLRIDCNACDWKAEQAVLVAEISAENKISEADDHNHIMDSDEEDYIALDILARYHRLMRHGRTTRKNKRKTRSPKSNRTMICNAQPESSKPINEKRVEESDESDEEIPLSALEKTVNTQNEEKRRKARIRKSRYLANPCSLASLPSSSAPCNPSNKALSGDEPESFSDRGSSRIVGNDSLYHPECSEFLQNEEELGNPRNETDTESNNDEVEILLTPREEFLFDDNSLNNTVGSSNNGKPEKLLTPRAFDEENPEEFDRNDDISFHGDPDDDDTANDSNGNYTMPLSEEESAYDQFSNGDLSEEEFDDVSTREAASDHTPKEYEDLLKFIDDLASEIEDTNIPCAAQKLSVLKARLNLMKRGRTGSLGNNAPELTSLADESYELHKFVVEKLIREGIDQCNRAFTRLCKERKSNLAYYRQTRALREQSDARLWRLNDSITSIDRNVTVLQKEIQKEIDDLLSSESNDDSNSSFSFTALQPANHDRKRNASGSVWGPHQHASKKRKRSSQKRLNNAPKERIERQENAARRKDSSKTAAETATSTTQNRQRRDRGERSAHHESVHVESDRVNFVGETDENDIQVSSRTSANKSVQRSQQILHSHFSSGNGRQSSRIYRTATESMCIRSESGGYQSGTVSSSHSTQRRLGTPKSDTNNEVRSFQSSKGRPANSERIRVSEPPLPMCLSAKHIFQSLSNKIKVPLEEINGEIASSQFSSESVVQICDALTNNYPNNVQKSNDALSDLSVRVLTDLQDDEVAAMFNSMLKVFLKKCSTFLDLLRCDPKHAKHASFQMSCWSLIFKMMEKKLHLKIQEKDGATCNIFKHAVPLASQILLQMIDCLYSQLLRPEWGATPRFDVQVFQCFDKLRDRIAMVVPLLPIVADLLRSKLGPQCWHRSKVVEQKENNMSELYFVSAINPDDHIQFLRGHRLSSEGCSRLSTFEHDLPRREINALWFMIGYFSCTPSLSAYLDCKHTKSILASMIHYNCGIFPKDYFPAHQVPKEFHMDTCCQEIEWTTILISSKSLGHLPDMDSYVMYLIDRAVQLNSRNKMLYSFSTLNNGAIQEILSKYWHCPGLNSDPQVSYHHSCIDSFELSSLLVSDDKTKIWCLPPSTRLVQNCTLMLKAYASLAMPKKAKWKRLSGTLHSLINSFQKKAQEFEVEPKTVGKDGDFGAAFGSAFPAIDEFTCDKRFDSPRDAYFRESACFMLLSCLIARRYSSSVGVEIALNKKTREQLLQLSSDQKTLNHQMHLLEMKQGRAPQCSDNLCSLFTSAKIMYFVALLHLFFDGSNGPVVLLESLDQHLAALGLDNDTDMLQHLVTAIVSPLLGCCDVQDNLSKDTVDSTLTCGQVIRSISMWIGSIYHRASYILIALTNDNRPSNIHMEVIFEAITKLGNAKFAFFLLQSLTRALKSISLNLPSRHSYGFERSTKTAFKSCLVAMRNVIGLIHISQRRQLLGTLSEPSNDSKALYVSAYNDFRNFLTSTVMKSMSNTDTRSPNRVLCRDQSGSLIGVYAALCTLCLDQSIQAAYDVFSSNPTATNEDGIYFKQMRACFSCELTRLSSFQSCRLLACLKVENVLNDFVMALVDLETLMIFPSCNVKQIVSSGGKDLRKDADVLLSAPRSFNVPQRNPDDEATLIKAIELCSDSVGPNYMIQNLWSFCKGVAKLLCECNIVQQEAYFEGIGRALVDTCENFQSNKELLEMEPLVSCERECLKRYILFTSLFTELVQVNDDSSRREKDISCTIVNSVFENIYFLSEIVLYHEKQHALGCLDKGSRFNRAKTSALQKAYGTFCGSLLALLIRKNVILDNDLRTYVYHVVIRIFAAKENVRDIIEDANKKPFFDFSLRKIVNTVTSSEKSYLQNMTSDLCASFLCRADDLLIHDAHCHSKGLPNALLHSMMIAAANSSQHGSSLDSFLTITTNVLLLTPVGIMVRSPRAHSELQTAIDHYLRFTDACRSGSSYDRRAIVNYREWVLDLSLATKLSTQNSLQRITLQLLTKMFKTFSSKDVNSEEKVYNDTGNMASFSTYAKIARSLKACFSKVALSNSIDATFMDLLQTCASAFLSLQVSNCDGQEMSTLFLFATHQTQSEKHHRHKMTLAYIVEFSKWLDIISSIPIQDPETLAMLRSVLYDINNLQSSNDKHKQISGSRGQNFVDLTSCLDSMRDIETLLFPREKVGQVNPYSKGRG